MICLGRLLQGLQSDRPLCKSYSCAEMPTQNPQQNDAAPLPLTDILRHIAKHIHVGIGGSALG